MLNTSASALGTSAATDLLSAFGCSRQTRTFTLITHVVADSVDTAAIARGATLMARAAATAATAITAAGEASAPGAEVALQTSKLCRCCSSSWRIGYWSWGTERVCSGLNCCHWCSPCSYSCSSGISHSSQRSSWNCREAEIDFG